MIGRQVYEKGDENNPNDLGSSGHTIPNPKLREIYQVVFEYPQFSESVNRARNLYNEYKNKYN